MNKRQKKKFIKKNYKKKYISKKYIHIVKNLKFQINKLVDKHVLQFYPRTCFTPSIYNNSFSNGKNILPTITRYEMNEYVSILQINKIGGTDNDN